MKVKFTRNELLYLDDKFTLSFTGIDDMETAVDVLDGEDTVLRDLVPEATMGASEELLLKIGRGLLESTLEVELDLTEPDLWRIRELAQSTVKVGTEPVGLNLKLKIYRSIFDIRAQTASEELIDSIGLWVDNNSEEKVYEKPIDTSQEETGDRHDNYPYTDAY